MSKYIKLEDAIRKYAEMIADESYWEHGVGNGSPDEEDLDIAREYYSDLPTIDIVTCDECKRWVGESEWYEDREYKQCQNGGMYQAPNHFCSAGERKEE